MTCTKHELVGLTPSDEREHQHAVLIDLILERRLRLAAIV